MKRRSFQLRLALVASVITGTILFAFGLGAWFLLYKQFLTSVDARLSIIADRASKRFDPWHPADRHTSHWKETWRNASVPESLMLILHRGGDLAYVSPGAEWLDPDTLAPHIPGDEEIASLPLHPSDHHDGPPRFGGRPPPRRVVLPPDEVSPPDGASSPHHRPGGPRDERPGPRPPGGPPYSNPHFFTATDPQGSEWRIVTVGNHDATLFTGTKLEYFENELRPAHRLFLATVPLSLIAIAGGGWLISRRALRPLNRISRTASRVTALGLDERIAVKDRDFSEFSQLVDVLNAMMERLETSFQQATRFTADASHELKTPIALLQAEVDAALKHALPGSPEERIYLNIAEEVQRLKRITQSLLFLSQVDSGHVELARSRVDLSHEITSLCEDAELLCANADLSFRHEIEEGVEVEADPTLLMQAAQNLLTNAVKYTPSGGSVFCSLETSGDEARLDFTNSGPGIAPDECERIFERFYRIDPARSRNTDGFGLGLNLAFEIVRVHRGRLELVDPSPGKTTFRIRIPLADAQ